MLRAVLALALAFWLRLFAENLREPHEWDFLAFYLTGQVAADTGAVYEPQAFADAVAGRIFRRSVHRREAD